MRLLRNIAADSVRGFVISCIIGGAVFFFQQTAGGAAEIALNFSSLLRGEYAVSPISDAMFYSFSGFALLSAVTLNLMPSGK